MNNAIPAQSALCLNLAASTDAPDRHQTYCVWASPQHRHSVDCVKRVTRPGTSEISGQNHAAFLDSHAIDFV
jgi:hypothetical protein